MKSTALEYVDEDACHPELRCGICHSPLVDAVEDTCTPMSHSFCHSCILSWLNGRGQGVNEPPGARTCPESRNSLKASDLKVAGLARRLTNELQVYCTNRENGCSWTGRRDNLMDHLKRSCADELLPCSGADVGLGPVYPGCAVLLKRAELESHAASCPFALLKPMFSALTSELVRLHQKDKRQSSRIAALEELLEDAVARKRKQNPSVLELDDGLKGAGSAGTRKTIIHLNARLSGEDGVILSFQLAKTTRLAKLIDSFAQKVGEFSSISLSHLDIKNAEYWFGTHRIQPDETPEDLEIDNNAEIVVRAPRL